MQMLVGIGIILKAQITEEFFLGTEEITTNDVCDIVDIKCAAGTANYSEVCLEV